MLGEHVDMILRLLEVRLPLVSQIVPHDSFKGGLVRITPPSSCSSD